jgi:CCR4-NOT transcription complex subunit 1
LKYIAYLFLLRKEFLLYWLYYTRAQLVILYGEDARAFLIRCLLEDIDFRDHRTTNHKDAPKVTQLRTMCAFVLNIFSTQIAVLTQELSHVLRQPNYVSTISQAFGADRPPSSQRSVLPELTEEELSNVCKTAKLNVAQTIAIGLALVQSSDPLVQQASAAAL